MIVVSYDISDNKLRTQFSRFLEKYGYRLQCSVFEVKNSTRVLNIIIKKIEGSFKKRFSNADSVIILKLSNTSTDKIMKFGYAKNLDEDIIFA